MRDERKAVVESGYDTIAEPYLEWISRIHDDPRGRMLDELVARLEPGARVLDLGCGSGVPSTRTLATRFRVTGVDLSTAQLAIARREVPGVTFIHGDLTEIDFPAASFDGVTAFYTVSHVPREEHAGLFRRVARWLVPGGLFLATLGATDAPDWIGDWLGGPMFFSSHDAETNRRLLAAAGFESLIDEIVETPEPGGPVPFLWVLARRVPEALP